MKEFTSPPSLFSLTLLVGALACSPRPTPPPEGPSASGDGAPIPGTPELRPAPTEEAFGEAWGALSGRHSLRWESDVSWHRHSLEVLSVAPEAIEGVVSIDQGIGPQGRAPTPDERVHTVRFRALRGGEAPGRLRFSVSVGELSPAVYTFDLHLCPISGVATCGDGDPGAAPHLRGVVKVGDRAGEQTMRAITASP